jgi:aspartyl-tRNA(Asn)/glutamyl-tRNA(Gln) amidotransferase subunit C
VSIGQAEVEYISRLSAIQVNPAEMNEVAHKLSTILELFTQLQAANTDGVEPMAHPLDQMQRLRLDTVTESDQRQKLQAIAPSVEDGLYLVPQVIE